MKPPASTALAARRILDWLPPYLATLITQGHARAVQVARVDEQSV